ncbi:MAG: hypothetical protein J3Q66DRAFT_437324 [Benniella sp.]|nr:MAG: hypothetical protein J3Q66DRAFT_437324 [Benniella sp.]
MVRSPIHVQELVEDIGQYLGQDDLFRCAQICKSWYEAFAPLLYEHVRHGNGKDKISLWTGVQRYGCHIRSIAITSSAFPERSLFGPKLCQLTTLSLGPCSTVDHPSLWCARLRDLIDHNPSIHTFQIHPHDDLTLGLFRENNILQRMPALKNLNIKSDFYPESNSTESNGVFEAVLECGLRLETLSYEVLRRVSFPKTVREESRQEMTSETLDTQLWTGLTLLDIHDRGGCRELELVRRSPNLKCLKARFHDGYARYGILQQLIHHYLSGHSSRLEHLEISCLHGQEAGMILKQLLEICAGSSGLKTFCFLQSFVPFTTVNELLSYHAMSLEKVVILNLISTRPVSNDLHRILTECPRLRHFEISVWRDETWLQDLVQSPWVCDDLRILHIEVAPRLPSATFARPLNGISSRDDDENHGALIHRQFWRQIGDLGKLEKLHLDILYSNRASTELFSIVDEDIEYIAGLQRLEELKIPRGQRFMSATVQESLQQRRPCLHINFTLHP